MSPRCELHNVDCITGMAELLEPESVPVFITSIPFESLFMYSGKVEDLGNNPSTIDLRAGRFALNLRFWAEQVYRAATPGAVVCIHIQQLRAWKVQHGYMGIRDFRGAVIDVLTARRDNQVCGECRNLAPPTARFCPWCGDGRHLRRLDVVPMLFHHVGEFVIPKNPQLIAKRLNLHSLMFETGRRDASKLAPAVNDYVLIFRKPGERPNPVRALYRADDPSWNPDGWLTQEEWIRDASGVWKDIRETDVLEGWQGGREEGDEKHVCPLQLTVIRRCKLLYTNPGDRICDPFIGVGSSAVVAMEPRTMLRTGEELPGNDVVGFELKESYHAKSLRYAALMLEGKLRVGDVAQASFADDQHFTGRIIFDPGPGRVPLDPRLAAIDVALAVGGDE